MLPGDTIVKKCSRCGGTFGEATIVSGNTFGAVRWTDGKLEAPMLPEGPLLGRCPHCRALVWMPAQEEVGRHSPWREWSSAEDYVADLKGREASSGRRPFDEDPERDAGAPLIQQPGLADYRAFLDQGEKVPVVERYARIRAWWAGNDPRRRHTDPPHFPTGSGRTSNACSICCRPPKRDHCS